MRRIMVPWALFSLTAVSTCWAQAPVTVPQDRVERREERRERVGDAARSAAASGENIVTPEANVQIPPAGSGRPTTVQTPRATVTVPRAVNPAAAATAADRAPAPAGEQWRYRRHNGNWWYYQPDKSWVVWSGNAWVPYQPNASRYATGYRGDDSLNTGDYNPAYDSYETTRRRGLFRGRTYVTTPAVPSIPAVPPPVRGSAIQGGGGQATGGPVGSVQERGTIRIGGGSSSQSSGARARGNLGTWGTAGGQVGGSGVSADAVER